jgi:hypothetical protein
MHTAHLIVCGVFTPGRATIFQRIMSDSVVSNHCTGYAPDGLISLLVIAWSPWTPYPFPIQANSHVRAHVGCILLISLTSRPDCQCRLTHVACRYPYTRFRAGTQA